MFGFFKRTKIESWETQLLCSTLKKLPKEYSTLITQIEDNLIRGVLLNISDIPGYVGFTYHNGKLKQYEKQEQTNFKITNIKIFDKKSSTFLDYEIYVSNNVLIGYSILGSKKKEIDLNMIDVSHFNKEKIGNNDYDRFIGILDKEERILIDSINVYSIIVNDEEYFHIKDLEDGNFIGMDKNKIIYKITHDPMEVVMLNKDIKEILN